eukprot:UN20498
MSALTDSRSPSEGNFISLCLSRDMSCISLEKAYVNTCFDVHLSYHEHLEELITEMLTLVLSPDAIRVTQEHFDSIKVQMNHGLRSQIKSAAYSQTKHTFPFSHSQSFMTGSHRLT